MKVYTRAGDQGKTRLYGKVTTTKSDIRIETYGDIDDLNAFIGYFVTYLTAEDEDIRTDCAAIQQDLFDCIRDLATVQQMRPYNLAQERIDWLEERIDYYLPLAPKIQRFIIPGGTRKSSLAHRLRTKTRHSERCMVRLSETTDDYNEVVMRYLNRLSDYFFAIARALNAREDCPDVQYERSPKVFGG